MKDNLQRIVQIINKFNMINYFLSVWISCKSLIKNEKNTQINW